jgi:hypothetical protein
MPLRAKNHLHILVTSLYYPAVLGVVFFSALDTLVFAHSFSEALPILVAYIGILTTFSVDLLYSLASRKYYTLLLFVADLVILLLMFLAYTSLIRAIELGASAIRFYWAYVGSTAECNLQ